MSRSSIRNVDAYLNFEIYSICTHYLSIERKRMYKLNNTLYSSTDLSRNNITNVNRNNFRGQDNLHELDLSKNKILNISSTTFGHLTVSMQQQQ